MDEVAKNVTVVGTGYVGLVTGTALAHLGHRVSCVDNDTRKVVALRAGHVPIYELGLEELLRPSVAAGRLTFTTDLPSAVGDSGIVFICVGTPMMENGEADLSAVEAVARAVGQAMDGAYRVIVNKSTVPVGTAGWVRDVVEAGFREAHGPAETPDFDVVSNPEFLREGSAVEDTFYPDRIVIGATSERAVREMEGLYDRLVRGDFTLDGVSRADRREPLPVVVTDPPSAEMIKYAANAFLALKISFINEIAHVCERAGADVTTVADGIGHDRRIGHAFLQAGLGWGGSCFGKDVSALRHLAGVQGCDGHILRATVDVNTRVRHRAIEKLRGALGSLEGRTIGLMGLAFKPGTDDLRDAPALTLADRLIEEGASVKAFDPVAMPRAAKDFPTIRMARGVYDLARGCDALVLTTEWPEFRYADPARLRRAMRGDVLLDGRNIYHRPTMESAGFRYLCFGR